MNHLDERMLALRQRFLAQTRQMMTGVEAAIAEHDWAELVPTAHSLAGRAAMFGYPEVGDAARATEEAIEAGASSDELVRLSRQMLDQLLSASQDR